MSPDSTLLAPTGTLRAVINVGNAVLAGRRPDGEPFGVSVDLASDLARRLGVCRLQDLDRRGLAQVICPGLEGQVRQAGAGEFVDQFDGLIEFGDPGADHQAVKILGQRE